MDREPVQSRLLPVFALGVPLFPRSLMPLRVFEPRYMDMIKECLRHDSEFGICVVAEAGEPGAVARLHPVGCTARVVEWDMPDLGILQIIAEGGERFHVRAQQATPKGLIMAEAEPLSVEMPLPVPAEFDSLVRLLRSVVETADERYFPRPLRFDDAVWVGFRLADALPLPVERKQQALALEDPLERLALIAASLHEQGVR